MSANFGPCAVWPVNWFCDVSTESATITGRAVKFATDILWAMSGQRFGTCSVKLRPCRRTCRPTSFPGGVWEPWPGVGFGPLYGVGSGGGYGVIDAGCAGCGGGCSCATLSEILLPAPVNSISEVRTDGLVLSGSAYRVDDNRALIRLDGKTWPACQNLLLDDSQPGTMSVTALYGEDPPASAADAVGELACEYIRAMHGEECQLPRNVTNLARQGVTITMPDLTAVIKEGRLGLRFCDLFLHAWNPARLTAKSRVYSVDGTLARRANT